MPSENYQLAIEEGEILYVTVTAPDVPLGIAIDYINEMMAYLRQTNKTRVLFQRFSSTGHSFSEHRVIGAVIYNMVPRHIRLAIVDHSPSAAAIKKFFDQEHPDDLRVCAFLTVEEAERWLRGKKDEC